MPARRSHRKTPVGRTRLWVHTVKTVSTAPPPGLFMKDAWTIARVLASKRVSPKGVTSGLRMLLFFINRAGHGLSASRRAGLLRAKRLIQAMVAKTMPSAARESSGTRRKGRFVGRTEDR
jgi:tRNA(adenine34) deaminase